MSVLLFANGNITDIRVVQPYLTEAVALIGVDGGTRHISKLGKIPDVVIGDLDSINPDDLEQAREGGALIKRHPSEKDETDLELALRLATENRDWQSESIYIFGAIGGRIDQTFANILLLALPELEFRRVRLIESNQVSWLTRTSAAIHGRVGDTISLIPIGGDVHIRNTTGLKWPLTDEFLRFGPARGVSNVLSETDATVTIANRTHLLITHSAS